MASNYGSGMGSVGSVLPLIFSACAVVISIAAFVTGQRQDRRDLFLSMHERLTDLQVQEGRRLLYERVHSVDDVVNLRRNEPQVYALIARSLAMFNLLGLYVERGYLDREIVLEEWADPLARCYQSAQPVLRDREQLNGHSRSLEHLRSFGQEAMKWHTERVAQAGGDEPVHDQ